MSDQFVFFIDKQRFKTDIPEITAKDLLVRFAEEDSSETTLVLKQGNELTKYEDDSQLIKLENGMHFLVYYDGPTTVSFRGSDLLINELTELGHEVELVQAADRQHYAIIKNYVVELGKFKGRVIDLGIPAMVNFPEAVGASIHVRATPQLFEKTDTIPGVRNIIDSALGSDWRYWSKNFNWGNQRKTTRRLMALIAGVFENA